MKIELKWTDDYTIVAHCKVDFMATENFVHRGTLLVHRMFTDHSKGTSVSKPCYIFSIKKEMHCTPSMMVFHTEIPSRAIEMARHEIINSVKKRIADRMEDWRERLSVMGNQIAVGYDIVEVEHRPDQLETLTLEVKEL